MEIQAEQQISSIKTSARSSVGSALLGILVSITNSFLQILMIYWILSAFGTEFNGFVRVSISMAIVGGTSEGALGVTTVILMAKPIMDKDWISANEIFSTAKRKYRNKLWSGLLFVSLISIAYPLFIALSPQILHGEMPMWEMPAVVEGHRAIKIWELGLVCFFFGFKQVISSSIFGVYENILEADKQNYLRHSIILFTDILVYIGILVMLNLCSPSSQIISGEVSKGLMISPVWVFIPIICYPFIRGLMIMTYVNKKYPWIKFYSDFNDYKLVRNSQKLFFSSMGINILMNFDIIILIVILGSSGLKVSSMLSIYMIIALNIRIIMLNFVISFREYFISIILKEGRIQWSSYASYELYTYVIAAFSFIVMAILTRFIATGLYGDVIAKDFESIYYLNETSAVAAQAEALRFIFASKTFSIIYAATTSVIIIIQGQFVLIQAKGTSKKVTKIINVLSFVYIGASGIILYSIYLIGFDPNTDPLWINKIIIGFYSIKLIFSLIMYGILWVYTWNYLTYNSSTKSVFSNFMFLVTPVLLVIFFIYFGLDPIAKVTIIVKDNNTLNITPIKVTEIVSLLLIVITFSLPICLIMPIIFKPKVGLSILLNIPILKQLLQKQKVSSKLQRFAEAGFNVNQDEEDSKDLIAELYSNIKTKQVDETIILNAKLDAHFEKKYNYKNTPKIYTVKSEGKIKRQKNR